MSTAFSILALSALFTGSCALYYAYHIDFKAMRQQIAFTIASMYLAHKVASTLGPPNR